MGISLVDNALDCLGSEVRLVVTHTDTADEHSACLTSRLSFDWDREETLCLGVAMGCADVQETSAALETVNRVVIHPQREQVALEGQRPRHRDLLKQLPGQKINPGIDPGAAGCRL